MASLTGVTQSSIWSECQANRRGPCRPVEHVFQPHSSCCHIMTRTGTQPSCPDPVFPFTTSRHTHSLPNILEQSQCKNIQQTHLQSYVNIHIHTHEKNSALPSFLNIIIYITLFHSFCELLFKAFISGSQDFLIFQMHSVKIEMFVPFTVTFVCTHSE